MVGVSTFKRAIGAAFASAMLLAATPASAADAEASESELNEERFSDLFDRWEAADEGRNVDAGDIGAEVSIPSSMPLSSARLTSSYGMRNHPIFKKRRAHTGIDLAAPTGTPIYATADGIVESASRRGGYGLMVQLDHGGDLETRYAHMSRMSVAAGERVTKGQLIGYVGSTGNSTGPHLHYEVRVANAPVDPTPYMTGAIDQETFAARYGDLTGQGGPE
ncbi:M23 family metallopeptidase [Pseudoblastomonas halimionae]|uniref:Peptidoglycan DD-metalloendopeptidase family protein n=1 Tax=Alteriqipengyuania halimionae TaxID=1926630 RepID=A0A6I4U783_9SPHN|nr:M23 family metallopeptidase [Alteriqipengyuania halimionae]MXP10675.1 peptidoglycan DD-metalloendopeptidase family protein [Alteriqipengyuania halimionae]